MFTSYNQNMHFRIHCKKPHKQYYDSFHHFLILQKIHTTICFKSYGFSSCDFNGVVLLLSSSFSNYSFFMNILIFYLVFAMFFLQIFTLCLYPFWKSLSFSNSSCNTTLSFSPITNMFFRLFTPKSNSPYSDSQLP